jgi:hypothetical protein
MVKTRRQFSGQHPVHFHRHHPAGPLNQPAGQHAPSGSDLQYLVFGNKVRRGDDSVENPGVGQKVLAKGLAVS